MCLRKSPARTPAFLAANRRNAQKCTGPRTPQGKARSALNSLSHGHYAKRLPETLDAAGYHSGAALYRRVHSEISTTFGIRNPGRGGSVDRLAAAVCVTAREAGVLGTKPESPVFCGRSLPRTTAPSQFRIEDCSRQIRLVYWVQRKRYWTTERMIAALRDPAPPEVPSVGEMLDSKLRRAVFRLRRPDYFSQVEYGLDREGNRDPAMPVGLSPEFRRLKRLREQLYARCW